MLGSPPRALEQTLPAPGAKSIQWKRAIHTWRVGQQLHAAPDMALAQKSPQEAVFKGRFPLDKPWSFKPMMNSGTILGISTALWKSVASAKLKSYVIWNKQGTNHRGNTRQMLLVSQHLPRNEAVDTFWSTKIRSTRHGVRKKYEL